MRGDIGATAAYIAGGGLAGVAALLDALVPGHSSAINAVAIACVSIAGLVRVVTNPTATYTATVFDRATGSTVPIKTVAPPSADPAPPPTYTTPP
jgi:hypothetical protein